MRNTLLKKMHQDGFKLSPRYRRIHELDRSAKPAKLRLQMESYPRAKAALLTQFRTNHVPLQSYLHRIQKAKSPICPFCNAAKETARHFLVDCSAFATQRAHLIHKLGYRARSVPYLLGQEDAIDLTLKFITATARFKRDLRPRPPQNGEQCESKPE